MYFAFTFWFSLIYQQNEPDFFTSVVTTEDKFVLVTCQALQLQRISTFFLYKLISLLLKLLLCHVDLELILNKQRLDHPYSFQPNPVVALFSSYFWMTFTLLHVHEGQWQAITRRNTVIVCDISHCNYWLQEVQYGEFKIGELCSISVWIRKTN